MGNAFNRLAHFGIGFGVGVWAHRPSALVATTAFVAYQRTEQNAIHDLGFPEIREFGYGMACGIAAREAYRNRGRLGRYLRAAIGAYASRAAQSDRNQR